MQPKPMVAPFGGMLRCLIRHDSNASAIVRAIGYIRGDRALQAALLAAETEEPLVGDLILGARTPARA